MFVICKGINLENYTEIKYVNANSGNDTTGDGSKGNPYKTIENSIAALTTSSPLIYIDEGIYPVYSLASLSTQNKVLTIIGNNEKTIIEIINTPWNEQWRSPSHIMNCIIRCSNQNGDETLSYTNDNINVTFTNVCFTKSSNSLQPSKRLFYLHQSDPNFITNKYFKHCSFDVDVPIVSIGVSTFLNCANRYSLYSTTAIVNSSISSCLFDNNHHIVDERNNIITLDLTHGIYSGDFTWILLECLLLSKSKYYTLDSDSNPVEIIEPLTDDIIMEKKTLLKNIDFTKLQPLESIKIILINNAETKSLKIRGLKSSRELITANTDISFLMVQNIDYFKLDYSQLGDSSLKMAISTDKGLNWLTWNPTSQQFEKLECTITAKEFNLLSSEELSQWNHAKDIIFENGIIADDFNNLDFNLLAEDNILPKTIRFAYVLSRPTYGDVVNTAGLSWQFDAKGYLKKMKDSEYDTDVYEHQLKFTSLIENPLIKVNILV